MWVFALCGALLCLGSEIYDRGAGRRGRARQEDRLLLRILGRALFVIALAAYVSLVLRRFLSA